MKLELKPHKWKEGDRNCAGDFFPFVDGEPKPEIANCCYCTHYVEGGDCKKGKEVVADDKLYAFCGPVCGYFALVFGSGVIKAEDSAMFICSVCGNEWTRDQYEAEMVAAYPLGVEDVSPNWCPSCGEDGEVEEVRDAG